MKIQKQNYFKGKSTLTLQMHLPLPARSGMHHVFTVKIFCCLNLGSTVYNIPKIYLCAMNVPSMAARRFPG